LAFIPAALFAATEPDERVWNDLKNNAVGRQMITWPKDFHGAVISHLRLIQVKR
jgi:hypothetical protein